MTYQNGPQGPYQPPTNPQPVKRRKRWPWVVGGIAGFLVFVSAIASIGGADSGTASGGSPTAPTPVAAPATEAAEETPAQEGPVRLNFGEAHTWRGGETIVVSEPREHEESNPYLGPDDGKRFVALDVSVRNNGDSEYQVMQTKLTVQHAGRVAQENWAAGDTLPDVQLPPGGETTFTTVYEVGAEPGELQVSVQPNMFAADTVYFVGEF